MAHAHTTCMLACMRCIAKKWGEERRKSAGIFCFCETYFFGKNIKWAVQFRRAAAVGTFGASLNGLSLTSLTFMGSTLLLPNEKQIDWVSAAFLSAFSVADLPNTDVEGGGWRAREKKTFASYVSKQFVLLMIVLRQFGSTVKKPFCWTAAPPRSIVVLRFSFCLY